MIISRKKFNEAIEYAKKAECERMWEMERFNSLEEHLNRRIGDLERRLLGLECTNKAPSNAISMEDSMADTCKPLPPCGF